MVAIEVTTVDVCVGLRQRSAEINACGGQSDGSLEGSVSFAEVQLNGEIPGRGDVRNAIFVKVRHGLVTDSLGDFIG
jgi:hypothetical protein